MSITQRKIDVIVYIGKCIGGDCWVLLNDLNCMLDDAKADIEAYSECTFDKNRSSELSEFATWLEEMIHLVEKYYYNT